MASFVAGGGIQSESISEFDPRTLGGCVLWLDAADSNTVYSAFTGTFPSAIGTTLAAVGNNVVLWSDKSGQANNATQNSSSSVATFTLNTGIPGTMITNGIRFGNLGSFRLDPNKVPIGTSPMTIFIVSKSFDSTTRHSLIHIGDNSASARFVQINKSVTEGVLFGSNNSGNYPHSGAFNTTQTFITTGLISGGNITSNNFIIGGWCNGTPFSTNNNFDGMSLNLSVLNAYVGIGAAAHGYKGDMNEILIFNRALQNDERQQVEGYLAWKWGVVQNLPVTHPYYYAKAPQTAFQPTSFPSCALWLDAADGNTVSGPVTQWNDKSGNGRHFVAAGSSPTPTFSNSAFLGRPGMQFTRTSNTSRSILQWTNDAAPLVTSDITLMMLVRRTASNTAQDRLLSATSALNALDLNRVDSFGFINSYGGSHLVFRNNNSNLTIPAIGSILTGESEIVTMTIKRSTLTSTIRKTISTGTSTGTRTGETDSNLSLKQLRLGIVTNVQEGTGDSSQTTFEGVISEVLMYNSVLSSTQLINLEGYLAWKYNLITTLLPTTHLYYYSSPVGIVPTNITGCQLWLDSADVTSISFKVSGWNDKSGNGSNATQSTAANQPTYLPGEKGVYYQDINRFMNISNLNLFRNIPYAGLFAVMSVNSAQSTSNNTTYFYASRNGGPQSRFSAACADASAQYIPQTGGRRTDVDTFQSAVHSTTYSPATNVLFFNEARYNDNTVSNRPFFIYLNGDTAVQQINAFTSSVGNTSDTASDFIQIGVSTGVSNSPRDTYYRELILFTNALSTAQRQQVEGYLAWKWNLQGNLPATHPFRAANYFFNNTRPFSRYFNPPDIEGCQLWLDAADSDTVTLSGSNVSTIRDKSGLGNNVTTSGSTITYSSTLNSLPVLTFPASGTVAGNTLTSPNMPRNTTSHSVFYVARYTSSTGVIDTTSSKLMSLNFNPTASTTNGTINTTQFGVFLSSGTNTAGIFQSRVANNTAGVGNSIITTNYNATTQTADSFFRGNTFVFGCVRQGASYFLSVNGNTLTRTVGGTFDNPTNTFAAMPNITNGVYVISGDIQDMQIGEVISYNAGLSPYQRQIVEGYLMWKWGVRQTPPTNLPMPTTHPFFSLPPTQIPSSVVPSKLYKRDFDISDLSPDLWLDAQDLSTMCVDSSNRVTQWRNKGTNTGVSYFSAPLNVPNSALLNVTNGNTSIGTLNGPMVTESTNANGSKIRYLDFSSGGCFPITGGSITAGTTSTAAANSFNATTGVIVLGTSTPAVNEGVAFSSAFGGLVANTIYFIQSVTNTTEITISNVYGGGALTLTGPGGALSSVTATIYATSPNMTLTIDYMPTAAVATSSSSTTKYTLSVTGGTNTEDLATVYFTPQLGIPYPVGSSITIAGTTNSSATSLNAGWTVVSAGSSYVTFTLTSATAGNLTANTGTIEYTSNVHDRRITFTNNDRQLFMPGQNVSVGSTDTNVILFDTSMTSIRYFSTSATNATAGDSISLRNTTIPTMTNRQVSVFLQNATYSNATSAVALGSNILAATNFSHSGLIGHGSPYIVQSQSSNTITLRLTTTVTTGQLGNMTVGAGHVSYGNIMVTDPYQSLLNYATVGTPGSSSATLRLTPQTGTLMRSQFEVGQTVRIVTQTVLGYIGDYYISAVAGNNIITIETPVQLLPSGTGALHLENMTMPHGCVGIARIDITGTTARAFLSLPTTVTGTLFWVNSRICVSGSSTAELNGIKTVTAADTTSVSWATTSTGTNIFGGVITADGSWSMSVTGGNSGSSTSVTLNFTTQSITPFQVGTLIRVAGVTPTAYNGTWLVTSSSVSSVSFTIITASASPTGGTISPVNRQGQISPTSGTISSGSTTATINYSSLPIIPFIVGQPIHISGSSATSFNGTYNVVTATTSSLTYTIPTAPGSTQTLAGTVVASPALFRISSSSVTGSGPFTITITYTQADTSAITAGGSFTAGQNLQITGANITGYNGNWLVLASPAPTFNTVSFSSSTSLAGITRGHVGLALPLTIGTVAPDGLSTGDIVSLSAMGSSAFNVQNLYTTVALDKYEIISAPTASTFRILPVYLSGTSQLPIFNIGPVLSSLFATTNNFPLLVIFPLRGYCLEYVGSNTVMNTTGVTAFCVCHTNGHRSRNYEVYFQNSKTANTSLADSGTYLFDASDFALGHQTFGVPRVQINKRLALQGIVMDEPPITDSTFRVMTSVMNMSTSTIGDVPPWTFNSSMSGARHESIFRRDNNSTGLTTQNITFVISNITLSGTTATVTARNTSYNFNVGGQLGLIATANLPITISGVTPATYNQNATILSASPTPSVSGVGVFTFGYTVTNATPGAYSFGGTVTVNTTANFSSGHMRIGAPPDANASYSALSSGTLMFNGYFAGGLSELIIFNQVLNREQRQLVEGCLIQKYNMQVVTGAPSNSSLILPPSSITITGGSSTTSGTGCNVTVTFATQTNPIAVPSLVTIASGTPSVINGTWAVIGGSSTSIIFFYPAATSITAPSAGTITPTVTTANASIHPYRANPSEVTGSNTLDLTSTTAPYAQNLVAWFDAANPNLINNATLPANGTPPTNDTAVTLWAPTSGWWANTPLQLANSGTATYHSTTAGRTQNGLGGIYIGGSTNRLSLATATGAFAQYTTINANSNFTWTVVFRPDADTASATTPVLSVTNGTLNRLMLCSDGTFIYSNGTTSQTLTPSTVLTGAKTHMITVYRDGTTLGYRIISEQAAIGYLAGTSTQTNLVIPTFTTPTLTFGAIGVTGYDTSFTGSIFEAALFRSAMSTQAIQQIEGYLAWKWGLQASLPTSHAYKRVPA